jgi:DNA-directed RNA polymerase specialized sigma24 family protein
MTMKSDPTQQQFDALLRWLGGSPEEAGRAYEIIRRRMIALFDCRGCPNSTDLADETINRVMHAMQKADFIYEGAPIRYFYGVAKLVHLESLRRRPAPETPFHDTDTIEGEHRCLDRCVEHLPERSRELVLGYYQQHGKARFDHRAKLASQLDIPLSTLRVQAHRIRALLRECITQCLEENEPRL